MIAAALSHIGPFFREVIIGGFGALLSAALSGPRPIAHVLALRIRDFSLKLLTGEMP
jgi:hypothetical protein